MQPKPLPPLSELRARFALDADSPSGLVWQPGRLRSGVAGTFHQPTQRWKIQVNKKIHQAARVVWALAHGKLPGVDCYVDHIDMDRSNNRPENLRLATKSQNAANRLPERTRGVGLKGVTYDRGKYKARITVNGNSLHLGRFDTAREAARVYDREAVRHFGDFARLNGV